MRQHPRVEPPKPLSPAIALHPVLSDALAHLDIQLEEELARYRRQRTGTGRTGHQPGRKRSSESLDLIAVSATASGHSTAAAQPAPALEERLANVAGQATTPDAYKPIPAFTATPQPFDGAIALRTPTEPLTQDGDSSSSLLSDRDDSHALAQATNPNLDDYLESSEELLRSLADKQAEVQAERNFMQSLLTPLGLGAMLLLLLSSAMFGYVIMNPSSLPWLTAKNNPPNPPSEQNTDGQKAIVPQPDLSKSELQQLNLNNLGTLNAGSGTRSSTVPDRQPTATSSSKPTAATTKAPVTSQPDSEPDATAQAPVPAVTSSSSRPYSRTTALPQAAPSTAPVPIPQAAATRSAPVPAPVAPARRATTTAPVTSSYSGGGSSGSYDYKVGILFENDQTLESARKVVPDAFVRTLPDGRTIVQGGAAQNEAEAKAMTQRLRDKGLSAEVYKR